jgi:hypothetical protein
MTKHHPVRNTNAVSFRRRIQTLRVNPRLLTSRAQHDLPRILLAATYSVALETAVRFRESAVVPRATADFFCRLRTAAGRGLLDQSRA